jgi:hypothetical protein
MSKIFSNIFKNLIFIFINILNNKTINVKYNSIKQPKFR